MLLEFRCVLMERKTKQPLILYPVRYIEHNDIEQAVFDVFCEETDDNFITVSCTLYEILMFD